MTWQAHHFTNKALPAFWVIEHSTRYTRYTDNSVYEYQGALFWDPDDVIELTIITFDAYSTTGNFIPLQLWTWPRLPYCYRAALNDSYWLNFTVQLTY